MKRTTFKVLSALSSVIIVPAQCGGGPPPPDLPPHTSVIQRRNVHPNGATIIVSGPEGWAQATLQCRGPAGILPGMVGEFKFVDTKQFYWPGDTTGGFDDYGTFGGRCPIPTPNIVAVFVSEWG